MMFLRRHKTVSFSSPACTGSERAYVLDVLRTKNFVTGTHASWCQQWLQDALGAPYVLMTPSCTHALEMAALLLELGPGDEVIMPSFTFATAATALVLRGAVPVFVDIRADMMNIDETAIEAAITPRTRAIMVMHYGGVACEMDAIMDIARRHGLPVIEDAAQALLASYKGRPLGTFGALGTLSFHQTKNFTAGEGGVLVINDPTLAARAEILQYKGTNRLAFLRGEVSRYVWEDVGSSWGMNELNAAYLHGNLQHADAIVKKRQAIWQLYKNALAPLEAKGLAELPYIPAHCQHNAHVFYLKLRDRQQREAFIAFMRERRIFALFHYIPLHDSPAGKKYGRFHGRDRHTTHQSERLVRLPIFYNMTLRQARRVVAAVHAFYGRS